MAHGQIVCERVGADTPPTDHWDRIIRSPTGRGGIDACIERSTPRTHSSGGSRSRGQAEENSQPLPIARQPPAPARTEADACDAIDEGCILTSLVRWLQTGETGRRLREHVTAAAAEAIPENTHAEVSKELGLRRQRHFVVSGMELFDAVPQAYGLLADWPHLDELLHVAAQRACGQMARGAAGQLHVRLANVPSAEFAKASVSHLRVSDCRRFTRVLGTVTRAGPVKVVQEFRTFRCAECGNKFTLRAHPASGYEFEVPKQCMSGAKTKGWDATAKRAKITRCSSRDFIPLPPHENCMNDFQEIRVQDQMNALGAGVVPKSIAVVLFGDLPGRIQPGDPVSLEGVVHQRWKPLWPGKRPEIELFIEATHIERIGSDSSVQTAPDKGKPLRDEEFTRFWALNRADEWRARAEILRATAPWLKGLPVPKLALLLTLIGGAPVASQGASGLPSGGGAGDVRWHRFLPSEPADQRPAPTGGRGAHDLMAPASKTGDAHDAHSRTTPHLLLLGDPGTGKSQLLQAAQELSARCVRTSGLGCTSAGLTCAAIREGPDFVLEAGALVLADGGICCIDEFSTIRSHDRGAVHEAMEQQTVSVAKGGIVCRLRSRCSVVAAQNCKKGSGSRSGKGAAYNREATLTVNSGLPPPLLSRFDLVVVFADSDKERPSSKPASADLADFIISAGNAKSTTSGSKVVGDSAWDHAKIRSYIVFAKENPLGDAPDPRAMEVVSAYFRQLRTNASAGNERITVRFMESLLRLAQAHARLMYHRRVELEDAIAVIVLHRAALQDHVVGADMGLDDHDSTAALPPTPTDQDAPACGIALRMGRVTLDHGSDVPDRDAYDWLESHILGELSLHNTIKTNLVPTNRLERSMGTALIDVDAGSQQQQQHHSQGPEHRRLRRQLGCRFH